MAGVSYVKYRINLSDLLVYIAGEAAGRSQLTRATELLANRKLRTMRNTNTSAALTLLVALFASPVIASAQRPTADEEPVSSEDFSESRVLHKLAISVDGAWMAAEDRSDRGDGNVRVWSTEGDVTFSIERGRNPRISRDSRWASALQKPLLKESKTATSKTHRTGQTLVLLDLQDGSRRTFDFVLSYDMTYASTYLVYLQSPETKDEEEAHPKGEGTKRTTKQRKAGTLHQVPLNPARLAKILTKQPDKIYTKENVVEIVTHPTTDHFAYVFHDEETGGDTLHIVKWGVRAWYNGDKIEGLCWARDHGGAPGGDRESITLGFLDSTETTGEDGHRRVNSILYKWHKPAESRVGRFTRVDTPQ